MANPVRGKQVFNPPGLMLPHAEPVMLISCQFWCCTNEPNAVLVFLLLFGDLFLINWIPPSCNETQGGWSLFLPLGWPACSVGFLWGGAM